MELVSRDGQPVDGQRERERERRGETERERERAEKREGAWRSKVSADPTPMILDLYILTLAPQLDCPPSNAIFVDMSTNKQKSINKAILCKLYTG